jgi:ubiquinone/menaquinone biosynthesis C-methylase UbiE
LVSTVIKNWDNKTWLSSQDYINSFNEFLIKNNNLNLNSRILDIGCGRGKILGSLSSKLKLKKKPLGIDIVDHKDRDKRINFKRVDASDFYSTNKEKFDLVLIKQTIHLLNFDKIKKFLFLSQENLSQNGRIFIFSLDTNKNELPAFKIMKTKLNKSFRRDKKIFSLINSLYPKKITKRFVYRVKINKQKYLMMIQKRYISTLLPMSTEVLSNGIKEINLKFSKVLRFNDNLICIIIKKS